MDSFYKRTDDIEQKIHSVKLPYLAWKVLFLIDEKQSVANLKELLSEEETVLQEALDILLTEGLIRKFEEQEEIPTEEIEEAEEAPGKEEFTETKAEAPQEEEISVEAEETQEPVSEIIEEEIIEETIIEKEIIEPQEESSEPAEEEIQEEDQEEEVVEPDFFAEEEPDMVIGKSKEESEEDLPKEEAVKEETETESVFDMSGELEDSSVFEDAQVEEEEGTQEPEIEISEEESEEESIKLDIEFGEEPESVEEKPVQAEAETVTPQQTMPGSEGIILVIDDSIVIRKMVELALENEDYQIETAVTGKDGLKLLDQLQPDLVILDLMLPDINGIDLLKTIKASKGIPVIMLSGKDSPQMIEKARAEGADAFLPKPFRDEELVQTIKNLIKK